MTGGSASSSGAASDGEVGNPLWDALFGRHEDSDRIFLDLPDRDAVRYDGFLALSARYARTLSESGLAPGDRVVAKVEKSPQALAIWAACLRAGLVYLPLNPAYTAEETAYFVADAAAGALICDPAAAPALEPTALAAGARLWTLSADGRGSLPDAAADAAEEFPAVAAGSDDLAAILYTSGTTGRSKGATLTQTNLLSNARTLAELWRFTAQDRLLHALPIYHTHGLFVACHVVLLTGGSMIWLDRFDTDRVIDALPRATTIMGVPTFYTRLLTDPRFGRDTAGHLRLATSGSAPLLAATHAAVEARSGLAILERYGMTETGMLTSNPYDGPRRPGTVGPPLPDVALRVTGDDGAPVPAGEVGHVEVRGPNVFAGYWRMPEKTAQEMRPGGYFATGDLGRLNPDGYLQIVGRDKDLIISGGFNVYPKEVEAVLDEMPGVAESAVIGAPHDDLGEAVVAVLVAERGETPDLDAIAAAASERLARYKRPRHVAVVDALPRNAMGKVQKASLREAHREAFARADAGATS